MHLPPIVWGPFFWHTMHIVALGYAKHPTYTDKKCAKEFYESLTFLIPCSVCREHYKEHFASNPITPFLDSKEDLLKWTIDIHNKVNKLLNKPQWTEAEVIKYYEKIIVSYPGCFLFSILLWFDSKESRKKWCEN